MKLTYQLSLCYAATVVAHGYVNTITLDNTIYPGFDPHQDLKIGAQRIVYSWDPTFIADGVGPITDVTSPNITCNAGSQPPGLVGKARAGSTASFEWTPWVVNHKGPLIAYMAKYKGDITKVKVQDLKFFKIAELGVNPKTGKWGTDEMIANGNKWNVTIPWDIEPGTYVIRHELLALHFATGKGIQIGPPGPQFYLMCAAVKIEGQGHANPAGNTFPGSYKKEDAGLNFLLYGDDLTTSNKKGYIIPGPKVYSPAGPSPKLVPNPVKVISPMGDEKKDKVYYAALAAEAKQYGNITKSINALPMGKNG